MRDNGSGGSIYHRYGRSDELISDKEWQEAPDTRRRIALALGPEPLEDARHLLAPVTVPPPTPHLPPGPHPATEFIITLKPANAFSGEALTQRVLSPEVRAPMGRLRLWGQRRDTECWVLIEEAPLDTVYRTAALCWELTGLLTTGKQAAHVLAGYTSLVRDIAAPLSPQLSEAPDAAGARTTRLVAVKDRYACSVEIRLMPHGRPFHSRQIWRTLYSLGLTWGHLDLFHWYDSSHQRRLFTISSVGQPGYFLPERAAEGEGTAGIALGFELPHAPAPVETYDRMAVALAYLRQKLGGRPLTTSGAELDSESLDSERDLLETAVDEMNAAGIPPGSPEAAQLF
jgi:hypothetical protein